MSKKIYYKKYYGRKSGVILINFFVLLILLT